jgi:hypothetical protein
LTQRALCWRFFVFFCQWCIQIQEAGKTHSDASEFPQTGKFLLDPGERRAAELRKNVTLACIPFLSWLAPLSSQLPVKWLRSWETWLMLSVQKSGLWKAHTALWGMRPAEFHRKSCRHKARVRLHVT